MSFLYLGFRAEQPCKHENHATMSCMREEVHGGKTLIWTGNVWEYTL